MSCGIDGEYCKEEEYAQLERAYRVVAAAFAAMVIVSPQGQPCYVTGNGVRQVMPKRIEAKVRAAMAVLNGSAR